MHGDRQGAVLLCSDPTSQWRVVISQPVASANSRGQIRWKTPACVTMQWLRRLAKRNSGVKRWHRRQTPFIYYIVLAHFQRCGFIPYDINIQSCTVSGESFQATSGMARCVAMPIVARLMQCTLAPRSSRERATLFLSIWNIRSFRHSISLKLATSFVTDSWNLFLVLYWLVYNSSCGTWHFVAVFLLYEFNWM